MRQILFYGKSKVRREGKREFVGDRRKG